MEQKSLAELKQEYYDDLARLRARRCEIQAGFAVSAQYALDNKRVAVLWAEEGEIMRKIHDIQRSIDGKTRL